MSAGFENSYRRSHPDVLERYRERQACVLRTDIDGQVTVRSDGQRLQMDMARWSGDLGNAPARRCCRGFSEAR